MKKMKITLAFNVWNLYDDIVLGSEILTKLNQENPLFEKINCISLGGYPTAPTESQLQYSKHYFVDSAQIDAGQSGKFTAVYRVLEGIKLAYQLALENNDDYAIVTNADAWILDINKIYQLLSSEQMTKAAVGCRVGFLTGLKLNMSPILPQTDDHFLILNIKECQNSKVFDYDNDVKFYHSKFYQTGGIHNILNQFFCTRVPENKLYVYSYVESAIGQFGDWSGWNLLPWQLEIDTMFLHANCAQSPILHFLRAELLRQLGLNRFPNISLYCQKYAKNLAPYRIGIKKGFPVRKRSLKRFVSDHMFFVMQRFGWILKMYFYKSDQMTNEQKKYFWKSIKIYPNSLLG